ncbi:MAG TPA: hypothetical protein VK623_08165 [Flavobacterium sp.]|nr:hypothetical protein [Flavobacterium sp.]
MRLICFCMLLISLPVFAQPKTMEIKIDSIITNNSNTKERKFMLYYTIHNCTDSTISFLLDCDNLMNNTMASMAYSPCYKIFQGDEMINIPEVFESDWSRNATKRIEKNISAITREKHEINHDSIEIDKNYREKLMQNYLFKKVVTLRPKEIKPVCYEFFWDKKRYHKLDDYEYYLDEVKPHFMEIYAVLMKEYYKDRLSAEQYQKIIDDKNFIKGLFVSNKMEIDFRE